MKIKYFFTRLGGLLLGAGIILVLGWMYTHLKEMPGAYLVPTFPLIFFLLFCGMTLHHIPYHIKETEARPWQYGQITLRACFASQSVAIGGSATFIILLVIGAFFPGLLQ